MSNSNADTVPSRGRVHASQRLHPGALDVET